MYQIYVNDDTLIYDSTLEDYKIAKGVIDLEIDKSGTFTFSVYPDHFYYYLFVPMKTVITVYKSGRIVFRGRVINEVTDYWNNKVLTCEGELGFLQDSVSWPYTVYEPPFSLLLRFLASHRAQVEPFKAFNPGTVNIDHAHDFMNHSSTDYTSTLAMMQSALTGSDLGGHFYITHGDDGTDPIPTLHYLKDFPNTSTQDIEFGVNLKDYIKTTKAEDLATAIIPLGAVNSTTGERLTIKEVNGRIDYIYDEAAERQYGWICKPVIWEDVTLANDLLTKAKAYLADVVKQNITIELNAIDLHLLDRSIASFNVGEYVRVISEPHHLDEVMLCNRQTMDLLQPENDTIVLGYATKSLTGASTQLGASVSTLGKQVSSIRQDATSIELQVQDLSRGVSTSLRLDADSLIITDAEGNEVEISGRQIKADELDASKIKAEELDASKIKAEELDASKIRVEDLQLSGKISFGDLDEDTQEIINSAGGISEEEAKTLISEELVASPTIKGGSFYDWGGIGCLTLAYTAGIPSLAFGYSGSTNMFAIGPQTVSSSTIALVLGGGAILTGDNMTVKAYGDWDFSSADVIFDGDRVTGISGGGGAVTAVFG